jgi:glycosyltransferase involved in cell wall biosynthesis/SAM-dependent methyltransferase
MKRLVVFTHKLFRRTAEGFQTTGALTVQLDALSPYFEQIILCAPLVAEPTFRGARLSADNFTFQPLPFSPTNPGFVRNLPVLRREILRAMQNADVGLAILPGNVGLLASWLCQNRGFPLFQWVVGDWGQIIRSQAGRYAAQLRLPLRCIVPPLIDWTMARLTRNTLTFFNGRILYPPRQPYHHSRISSSISRRDFYRRDPPQPLHTPPRLLYVGRLSEEKGLPHLLEAIARLIGAGEVVELHIVGEGEMEATLREQARALAIEAAVHFHGYVPHGEVLSHYYRANDLFILPSLQDQQPKVLLEAMSQSLPVIATQVGGITTLITDGQNGLLIPPAQPSALANAVRRLLSDTPQRQQLAEAGLKFAENVTVERETERLMKVVSAHFEAWKGKDFFLSPIVGKGSEVRLQDRYFTLQDGLLKAHPEQRHWLAAHRELAARLLSLQPSHRFVDLGCGEGYFTLPLSQQAGYTIGIDLSPGALAVLRAQPEFDVRHFQTITASGDELPLPAASVDRLLCNHVLEHVSSDDAVVGEIRRVLRPGGLALIGLPLELGLPTRLLLRLRRFLLPKSRRLQLERAIPGVLVPELLEKQSHVRFYSWQAVCNLLERNGLRLVSARGIGLGLPGNLRNRVRRNRWLFGFCTLISRWQPDLGDGVLVLVRK